MLFNIFFYFITLVLFSFILQKIWLAIFPFNFYRVFVGPGIVLHEISHYISCLLTGTKVKKISFFKKEGGNILYESKRSFIKGSFKDFIIGVSPLFFGIIFIFILAKILNLNIAEISFKKGLDFILREYTNWKFWIFVYFTVSITISMVPSKTDFKNSLKGIIFLFIFLFILSLFGIKSFLIFNNLLSFLIVGLNLQIIAIIVSIPFYFILKRN